jgi:IS30 family transposase
MRRMMPLAETAEALGVTNGTICRAIKRTGMRWRLQKQKAHMSLTMTT